MKAVLVIDMPKSCLECEFCGYIADIKDGFRSCFLNKHCFEERYAEEEYLMCPLRPLPEKKLIIEDYYKENSGFNLRNQGWNDCIDAITGETDGYL